MCYESGFFDDLPRTSSISWAHIWPFWIIWVQIVLCFHAASHSLFPRVNFKLPIPSINPIILWNLIAYIPVSFGFERFTKFDANILPWDLLVCWRCGNHDNTNLDSFHSFSFLLLLLFCSSFNTIRSHFLLCIADFQIPQAYQTNCIA